jgi:hypothetical protein
MASIRQVNLKQTERGLEPIKGVRAGGRGQRGRDAAFRGTSYSERVARWPCDKASPIAFVALHTRAGYVSKAAI